MKFTLLTLIVCLVAATTTSGQEPGPEQWRQLGRQASDAGQYSEAEQYLRRALAAFENGTNSFELALTLSDLAGVLSSQERFSEAEPMLVRGFRLMLSSDISHARDAARMMGNLGAMYVQTGRH